MLRYICSPTYVYSTEHSCPVNFKQSSGIMPSNGDNGYSLRKEEFGNDVVMKYDQIYIKKYIKYFEFSFVNMAPIEGLLLVHHYKLYHSCEIRMRRQIYSRVA